jgi:DNA/RNA endonuclease YhcR with UshA esterase domain
LPTIGPLTASFETGSKTVAVSGKNSLYHGKPEIIVTNVSQIIIK